MTNYSSCTVRSSENIYVAAMEVLREKKRKDRMKLSLPPMEVLREKKGKTG
jgi:hypothetical protein